jgi:cyclopropane fatty-acyl-phospholipid synthase-like methyltransferase
MAQAYPKSTFVGFDFHEPSIYYAKEVALQAGVADRVRFEVATASAFLGHDYDFVAAFDCLHDMGNPIDMASHVRKSLTPNGTWMVVEPFPNHRREQNLNRVGRIFYLGFDNNLQLPPRRLRRASCVLVRRPARVESRMSSRVWLYPFSSRDGNRIQPHL